MSWLSAAWQRNKGAISGIVSHVPVVGGVLSGVVSHINTGDAPGAQADPAVQALAERTAQFAADEAERVRMAAANEVARLGAAATLSAAAAIGPPGNVYQRAIAAAKANPTLAIIGVVVFVLIVGMLMRGRRK